MTIPIIILPKEPKERAWFPHRCFAGEPMREGQFREPWPMKEELPTNQRDPA